MTLVVEDGSSMASSNTYYSLASITAYCSDMGYTSWAALATTAQESAILRGMSYVEAQNWKGQKYSSDQALEWPREGVWDKNGYLLSVTDIPLNLKKAVAEAAYREGDDSGTLQEDLSRGGMIKRKKIGPIETEYFRAASPHKIRTIIKGLLKGLVIGSDGSVPVSRS